MKRGSKHAPGFSERHSKKMREVYQDPDLRERVSAATKVSVATKQGPEWIPSSVKSQMRALNHAWRWSSRQARRRFLNEILSSACNDAWPSSSPNVRQLILNELLSAACTREFDMHDERGQRL